MPADPSSHEATFLLRRVPLPVRMRESFADTPPNPSHSSRRRLPGHPTARMVAAEVDRFGWSQEGPLCCASRPTDLILTCEHRRCSSPEGNPGRRQMAQAAHALLREGRGGGRRSRTPTRLMFVWCSILLCGAQLSIRRRREEQACSLAWKHGLVSRMGNLT